MRRTLFRTLSDYRPPPARWMLAAVLLLLGVGFVDAGEIRNSGSGNANGMPLDPAQSTVRLNRVGGVVSWAFAEISPNEVTVNSPGNAFEYDILPTIQPGDTGIQSVEITVPPGYANLAVTAVTIGGGALVENCPAPGTGQYCATAGAGLISVLLGDKVTVDQARINVEFNANAPPVPGTDDFVAKLVDGANSMSAFVGNADGDAADADSITVEVLRTQGLVLQLTKLTNKEQVVVGEVVTYSVMIRNTVTFDVIQVRLDDSVPANFKYIAGSARLDGAPIADPSGNRTLVFDVGQVAALVDANGNGSADPGEPGYSVLSYQMVVGSGALPGEYENTVVAKDFCDDCVISNEARARVTVILDPVFDLGLIIGKVFLDHDRNGRQDAGEPGVEGAMVALDDGTYALTDPYGRYHFPAVKPGYRMVKINLDSLPPGTRFTKDRSRILWVTPGLMLRANFGVLLHLETEDEIGNPPRHSVRLDSESKRLPIDIRGDADTLEARVAGQDVPLPVGDVRLGVERLEDTVRLVDNRLVPPPTFTLEQDSRAEVTAWRMTLFDDEGETFKTFAGEGSPPATLTWDGTGDDGRTVSSGEIYRYRLELDHADGSHATSTTRHFGVDRTSFISIDLTGDAFESGKAVLKPHARETLAQAAAVIRRFPGETVVIEGHTDWVGTEEYNIGLSQRRAQAALEELVGIHGLPRGQFALNWFGESRPIADNRTAEGRARNRRVEIEGQFKQVERADHALRRMATPTVRIDGTPLDVAEDGSFAAQLADDAQRRLDLEVSNEQGQSSSATVPLPGLELTSPSGSFVMPYEGVAGGCRSVETADGVVVCRIEGRTEPENVVRVGDRTLSPDAQGHFSFEHTLPLGNNEVRVAARNPQGYSRTARLDVLVSDRDDQGSRITVEQAIPNLAMQWPPEGVRLRVQNLPLAGVTDPGNTIRVNGTVWEVQPDGSFSGTVELPLGPSRLRVEVEDPEGRSGVMERNVDVARNQLFFMAFADGKVSRLDAEGRIEAAGLDQPSEYFVDGRLAFYLKGRIAGKYLIAAAFDSKKDEAEYLFRDIDLGDTQRLLTNLDPDRYYPVYGDSSTVVYDAQSEGKLYLAVDSDTIHGHIGNYALAFTDTELAGYQRTLYGGTFTYRSASRTESGHPDTEVALFVADVKQVHVEDELRATGGSLYYLSRPDVIEGSEQVTLVVRDENTGLILSHERLQQNVDYQVKYIEGRLLFFRPVPSIATATSIAGPNVLAGNPVFIRVDYEAHADGFDKSAAGARVRRRIGERVSIGATYIEDEPQSGPYELGGLDAEVRIGEHSRLVAEYAESEGSDSLRYFSDDGGVTYTAATTGNAPEGSAWKIAGEVDLGEWFGKPQRYRLGFYAKSLDSGFFSSGSFLDRGADNSGVHATLRVTDKDTVSFRHDREERSLPPLAPLTTPTDTTLTRLRWDRQFTGSGLGLEVYDEQSENAAGNPVRDSSLAAARYWKQFGEKLKASFELQQTLSGLDRNQATAAVEYQILPTVNLNVQGTEGSQGRSALAGLRVKLDDQEVYLAERIADDVAGKTTSTVLGTRSPFGKSGKVYSEYQLENTGAGRRESSVLGLKRQWELSPGLLVSVHGELAKVDSNSAEHSRSSIGTGLFYSEADRVKAASRVEIRFDEGNADLVQVVTLNSLDYAASPDWTLLAKFRYSKTSDRTADTQQAKLDERSIGFAFRPVKNDRFNLISKYTHLFDLRPLTLGTGEKTEREMDVLSVESAFEVGPLSEWLSKLAYRDMRETVGNRLPVDSGTYLVIQRFNMEVWRRLEIGAEYRVLGQREADDRRQGWLGEMMWNLTPEFRLGTGYNFTDFSDDEFSTNDYSVEGWFLRIQGRY